MNIGELPEKELNRKKFLEKKTDFNNKIQVLEHEIEKIKTEKNDNHQENTIFSIA